MVMPDTALAPDLSGVWGDVVGLVGRIYRRKNFHKRRIVQLFREFRRLTAVMPEGVVLLSPEREILWFNRTAGQLLGLKRKVDFGVRIENLVRQPEFTRYLELGSPATPVVFSYGPAADRYLACQVISAGDQHLLLARDVTRETRLEEMRKDFVANASHELRTPMAIINGYLENLLDDHMLEDPDMTRRFLTVMRKHADRISRIVEDMLVISRLGLTMLAIVGFDIGD